MAKKKNVKSSTASAEMLKKHIALLEKENAQLKKRAKESSHSHYYLDDLMQQLPAMVWKVDTKLTLLELTGIAVKKHNLDKKYLIGTTLYDYDRATVAQTIKEHKRVLKGERRSFEFSLGDYHLSIHIAPFFNEKGKIIGCVGLGVDISDKVIISRQLEKTRKSYKILLDSSPDPLMICTMTERVLYANQSALKMVGCSSLAELKRKRNIFGRIHEEFLEGVYQRVNMAFEGKKVPFQRIKFTRYDGKVMEIETKSVKINYNEEPALLIVCQDISVQRKLEGQQIKNQIIKQINQQLKIEIKERRNAESKLKQSLYEKEILLKEVHHRVKNNLQIISSIINLQLLNVTDPRLIESLKDCQNRVRAMSFIHESLYQSKNFSKINVKDYISKLSKNIIYSYTPKVDDISLHLDIQQVFLDIDQAIPCGLIVNELVTNALKHAYNDEPLKIHPPAVTSSGPKEFTGNGDSRKRFLFISLVTSQGEVILKVKDNGKGIDPELNIQQTESLGFQLVFSLVKQLKGNIEIELHEGTEVTIIFNIPLLKTNFYVKN